MNIETVAQDRSTKALGTNTQNNTVHLIISSKGYLTCSGIPQHVAHSYTRAQSNLNPDLLSGCIGKENVGSEHVET